MKSPHVCLVLLLCGVMHQVAGPLAGQTPDAAGRGESDAARPKEARPAGPAPAGPKTLDEQLLESLGDPLEELDRPGGAPGGQRPEPPPGKPRPPGPRPEQPLAKQLAGELGAAAVPEDDNPMLALARQMRQVEERIARGDCGEETRKTQRDILAKLDALMRQSRCAGGSPGGSGQPKPGGVQPREATQPPSVKPSPQADPSKPGGSGAGQPPGPRTEAKSPGRSPPDMDQMRTLLKRLWGELPPQERQQMLELPVEEFLPEYDRQIEDYFRRLSEE